ncbi:DUF262 domain-containing protein [Iodobacter sp.]|uniref:DUF262 domain-containing protein n=1 Tax=Iodobacter sp. TaxID=1915058 RepID=UPI0025F27628|nr:DUF262 domain-containing protein [Iodobacter sp.]
MSHETFKEDLSENGTLTGIEDNEEDELILEPFDPDSISIDQRTVPMDTLIRRLKQKSIRLSPNFQRNEVWDDTRRSQLIESIMLKIPLPMFYVASNEEGQWEVVDGLQRLSTIRNFILGDEKGNEFKLKNLEFLGSKLNNKTYKNIERDLDQQRLINTIMETEMRFTIINPGTPEAVKRNIFKRINTGGMPLTVQEIRHALYQGKSSDLLVDLVNSDAFKQTNHTTFNDTRMGARELILRAISFMLLSRNEYKPSMDSWLSNTMRIINCMPELDQKRLEKIYPDGPIPNTKIKSIEILKFNFELAMTRSKKLFGSHAFRKSLPGDRKAPINKALFESWSNILCELNDNDFEMLVLKKDILFEEYKKILNNSDFNNAISRNASQAKEIVERYRTLNELITDTLKGLDHD